MPPMLLAAFLTSTALVGTALAQSPPAAAPNPVTPGIGHRTAPAPGPAGSAAPTHELPSGEAQARAAISECDRLASLIGQSGSAAGVTLEQAEVWKRTSNAQLCRTALERLDRIAEAGATGAGIRPVELPPPGDEPGIPDSARAAAAPPAPPPEAPAAGAGPTAAGIPEAPARPLAQSGATTAGPPAPQSTASVLPPAPAAPQVLVQQSQPEVTVRQQQPEVIVRMPPPLITVQQPQPEVIVRMPKPDVNVSTVQPDVRVVMPQPKIQVMPPQQAQAEPEIRMDGRPQVRVERMGEPKVIYQQAEGQPQVRFEPMEGREANAAPRPATILPHESGSAEPNPAGATGLSPQGMSQPAPSAATASRDTAGAAGRLESVPPSPTGASPGPAAPRGEPQQTGALPDRALQMDPSRLPGMPVHGAGGDRIGDVKRVVAGPGDRLFLVISFGGFLGLGEQQALLPVDDVAIRGDQLVAENLTEDQAERLPAFAQGSDYRDVQTGRTASIRTLE